MAMALSFGVLSSPVPVSAGLLSLFFGDEVSVSADLLIPISDGNSQNMALLQASVFPVSGAAKKADKEEVSKVTISTTIESLTALAPVVGPIGSEEGAAIGGSAYEEVSVYVVRSGDSLSAIAEMFGVTVDTVLSANDMKKGDKIKEGMVLLILPFSGVEHTVAKGDTLQGIAKKYKVDIEEILLSNDIDTDAKLSIGDKLMIPGGSLSSSTVAGSSGVKSGGSSQGSLKTVSGYFINPVPGAKKSRGTSASHRGVDLAIPMGTPIKAAASGRVIFARSGYNGGFGNLVIIAHDNGTETLYPHQSKINTSVGTQVSQGDIIGYVGNTGRSTGPHLHFEVRGAKNPGDDGSWAR